MEGPEERDVTRLGAHRRPSGCCGGGQTFLVELVGATLSSLPSRQRKFPEPAEWPRVPEFPVDSPRPEPPGPHTGAAPSDRALRHPHPLGCDSIALFLEIASH